MHFAVTGNVRRTSSFARVATALAATRLAAIGLAATGLVGCGGDEQRADTAAVADSSVSANAAAPAALPSPTTGMNVPESVRYDAELDAYFVSNVNGVPSTKDNNGFISRIDATAPNTATPLVEGGKNGITLNAPKGMAIVGDTLWVADIDVVRGFDRRSGAVVAAIDLSSMKAQFLNDVAVGPDGALYITDSGLFFDVNGTMSHPGIDRVFVIRGRDASVALEGDFLARPNGITWDAANGRFLLAPFGAPGISEWKPGETAVTQIASGPGAYDGIEVLADGRFLVTSWADSSLNVFNAGTLTRVAGGLEAPADIGVDAKRGLVAVPRFNAGRVDYVAVPSK